MTELTDLAIPFFLALIALEAVLAARRGRRVFHARDTAASLATGVGSVVVSLGWKGVAFGCYSALHRVAPLDVATPLAAIAPALALGVLLVADDFAYYWFHRLHHEVRVLWASHVPHHSSREYNLSTALRQSWTPLTALPFYAPLPLLGFDPLHVVTVHSINLLYQFWIHTQLVGRLGPVEWVLNTPSHHRVHHGSNPRYLDRNYGGILILWDRLFGSFEPESEPVRYGLTKNIESFNPVRIAFQEWVAVGRDALRAPNLRQALGHLFAPPGWQPPAVVTPAERRASLVECGPSPAAS